MSFGLLLANVTVNKVTAVGIARCIDDKQTYQLSQLYDDTIANIINLFHLECVVFLRQGFRRVVDINYTANVLVDAILEWSLPAHAHNFTTRSA